MVLMFGAGMHRTIASCRSRRWRRLPLGFGLARGAHISFSHPAASRLCKEMIAAGIIPDFREPDLVRVGLSPLSTSFMDVWRVLAVLADLA